MIVSQVRPVDLVVRCENCDGRTRVASLNAEGQLWLTVWGERHVGPLTLVSYRPVIEILQPPPCPDP